jgi:hypothetical protein
MKRQTNVDRIEQALRAPYELPVDRAGLDEKPSPTYAPLFNCDEPWDGWWDKINIQNLLQLKQIDEQHSDGRYTLRPYWLPATTLYYRCSGAVLGVIRGAEDVPMSTESQLKRSLVKCQSFRYMWRDDLSVMFHIRDTWMPGGKTTGTICCYNHARQTLQSMALGSQANLSPTDTTEAKRLALTELPFIYPWGTVRVGDSWQANADKDCMTYTLLKEETVADMVVLVIKREGCITFGFKAPKQSDGDANRLTVKGVTAFAPNRAVVLEDRLATRHPFSRNDGAEGQSNAVAETMTVTRLVRSVPAEGASRSPRPMT